MLAHRARRSRGSGNVCSEIAPRDAGAAGRGGSRAPRVHRGAELVVSRSSALLAKARENRRLILRAVDRAANFFIVELSLGATTSCEVLYTARGSCYCVFPYRHSRARRLGSDREPATRFVGRPRNGRDFDDGNSFPEDKSIRFSLREVFRSVWDTALLRLSGIEVAARRIKSRVRAMRDKRGH